MLRKTIFGKSIFDSVITLGTWIYDTSTFYSNDSKITVKRVNDSVIQNFTPLQITDGTYTTWLGGSEGLLEKIKSDGTIKEDAIGGTTASYTIPKMLNTGIIDMLQGYSNLISTFNAEINTSLKLALVIRNPNNQNNGRQNFGVVGLNSGISINYRSVARIWYVGWKDVMGAEYHYSINTPAMIDSNYNNVVVFEMPNNVPKFIVNGVSYSSAVLSNASWTYFLSEIGQSKIFMGNRPVPVAKIAQYKNFSVYLGSTKTAIEISNELISIHQ